jgi:hypothetical protein
MTGERSEEMGERREAAKKLIRIHREMAKEIIADMEHLLKRPYMRLLGTVYDKQLGSIRALYRYADKRLGTDLLMFRYMLREEITEPRTQTAHLVSTKENPEHLPMGVFINYLDSGKVPGFTLTKNIDRIRFYFNRVMTPKLALAFIKAGVNLERAGRGLPAIDFSDSSGGK